MEVFLLASDTDHEGYGPKAIYTDAEAAKSERDRLNEREASSVTNWVVLRFKLDDSAERPPEYPWDREVK